MKKKTTTICKVISLQLIKINGKKNLLHITERFLGLDLFKDVHDLYTENLGDINGN